MLMSKNVSLGSVYYSLSFFLSLLLWLFSSHALPLTPHTRRREGKIFLFRSRGYNIASSCSFSSSMPYFYSFLERKLNWMQSLGKTSNKNSNSTSLCVVVEASAFSVRNTSFYRLLDVVRKILMRDSSISHPPRPWYPPCLSYTITVLITSRLGRGAKGMCNVPLCKALISTLDVLNIHLKRIRKHNSQIDNKTEHKETEDDVTTRFIFNHFLRRHCLHRQPCSFSRKFDRFHPFSLVHRAVPTAWHVYPTNSGLIKNERKRIVGMPVS